MRAPVETMINSNRWCSEESITTTKLDHLDHLIALFVYLYTPRFRSPKTEKKKKKGTHRMTEDQLSRVQGRSVFLKLSDQLRVGRAGLGPSTNERNMRSDRT